MDLSKKPWYYLMLQGLVVLAALALTVQLARSWIAYAGTELTAIRYPYSLDYGEGPLLDQTLRLSRFENIYRVDLSQPPYTISNYPPMFPLVQVPFVWLFGPAFWYGRMLAALSILLTAVLVGVTLHALFGDWLSAGLGGALVVAFPFLQHWSLFNRIDDLALVLSWAGIFTLVRFGGFTNPAATGKSLLRRRGFWVGAALLIAAIFTRQTYALAAPLAMCVWALFTPAPRFWTRVGKAFALGIVTAGITLMIAGLVTAFTRGGFFLHVVTANVNTFYWETVRNYANSIRDHLPLLLLMAGVFILFGWIKRRQATPGWALVSVYALAATAGSLTIGKDGSNVNYLYEFSAALALCAGAVLAWMRPLPWLRWVVMLALVWQVGVMIDWTAEHYTNFLAERVANQSEVGELLELAREADGIVIADEYMGLIPLAGKQLYFQPFEYKMMVEGGVWDQTNFLMDAIDQKFALVLWYRPESWGAIEARYTPQMIEAIQSAYRKVDQIGDVWVMLPREPLAP